MENEWAWWLRLSVEYAEKQGPWADCAAWERIIDRIMPDGWADDMDAVAKTAIYSAMYDVREYFFDLGVKSREK